MRHQRHSCRSASLARIFVRPFLSTLFRTCHTGKFAVLSLSSAAVCNMYKPRTARVETRHTRQRPRWNVRMSWYSRVRLCLTFRGIARSFHCPMFRRLLKRGRQSMQLGQRVTLRLSSLELMREWNRTGCNVSLTVLVPKSSFYITKKCLNQSRCSSVVFYRRLTVDIVPWLAGRPCD